MKKVISLIVLLTHFVLDFPVWAQQTKILLKDIRTVQVKMAGNSHAIPMLRLGTSEQFEISFDQMSNEYHRYVYRIVHLDADFKQTEDIFENDWAESSADWNIIDDYTSSTNTVTNYTHYSLPFPNPNLRPRLSGNYRLEIRLDDHDTLIPAIDIYFYVLDQQSIVGLTGTTNTDVDWNGSHQQIRMIVDTRQLIVSNPKEEIHTVVLQNHRWDNAARNPQPDYINGTKLEWKHQRDLLFDAGNEYRRFEMLSTHYPCMGIEKLWWTGTEYQANLFTASPRSNYLYNEDRNGEMVNRTQDNDDPESQSEYIWVNFSLLSPQIPNAEIYVSGDWTYDRFLPENRLTYDEQSKAYLGSIFLKTGFYSYQYLVVPSFSTKGITGPIEGNFFQTENEYSALVYYHRRGDRYWQLVGFSEISFNAKGNTH